MVEMKFRDDIFLGFAVIVSALAIYFGLYIAPAEVALGELVRVFYLHLPQAIICYLSLVISVITAILFLVKKDPKYDALSEPAAFLGLVYGAITLISGSIWANAAWGVYWNWDPREISLYGSSRSPKYLALAGQVMTQAGVASRSTPGFNPFSIPSSTLSTQKMHFTTVPS